jgi:hypothetical protein
MKQEDHEDPIITDAENPVENSMLDNHGFITLEMIKNYEESYMDINGREQRQDMHNTTNA